MGKRLEVVRTSPGVYFVSTPIACFAIEREGAADWRLFRYRARFFAGSSEREWQQTFATKAAAVEAVRAIVENEG